MNLRSMELLNCSDPIFELFIIYLTWLPNKIVVSLSLSKAIVESSHQVSHEHVTNVSHLHE